MNRVLKTFLLLLLIAALPIQGYAAVLKASCGPVHHRAAQAAVGGNQHYTLNASDMHSLTTSDHIHAIDAAAVTAAMSDERVPPAIVTSDSAADTVTSAICSGCAACCSGAVGPPTVFVSPSASNGAESVVLHPIESVVGVVPAGLERPPKVLSA